MPLLVRWPAAIRPGSRTEAMALNVDFAPTFLEAAGVAVPASMQGRSLVPLLRGETPGGLAHGDLLPLLPRPRPPQHARPLRRPDRDAQAHLLLEEEPVGAVRPALRPRRAAQPLRPAGRRRRSRRSSRRRSRACGPSCRTTTASPTSSRPPGSTGRWPRCAGSSVQRWQAGQLPRGGGHRGERRIEGHDGLAGERRVQRARGAPDRVALGHGWISPASALFVGGVRIVGRRHESRRTRQPEPGAGADEAGLGEERRERALGERRSLAHRPAEGRARGGLTPVPQGPRGGRGDTRPRRLLARQHRRHLARAPAEHGRDEPRPRGRRAGPRLARAAPPPSSATRGPRRTGSRDRPRRERRPAACRDPAPAARAAGRGRPGRRTAGRRARPRSSRGGCGPPPRGPSAPGRRRRSRPAPPRTRPRRASGRRGASSSCSARAFILSVALGARRGAGRRLQRPTAEGGTCRRERKLDTRRLRSARTACAARKARSASGVSFVTSPAQARSHSASCTGRASPSPAAAWISPKNEAPWRARCSRIRSWRSPRAAREARGPCWRARAAAGGAAGRPPGRGRGGRRDRRAGRGRPRPPRPPRTACRGPRAGSPGCARSARPARGSRRGGRRPAAARSRRGARRGRGAWRGRWRRPASPRAAARGRSARRARPAFAARRASGGGASPARPARTTRGRARRAGTRPRGRGRPSGARRGPRGRAPRRSRSAGRRRSAAKGPCVRA